MIELLVLAVPPLLMVFLLFMQRVEVLLDLDEAEQRVPAADHEPSTESMGDLVALVPAPSRQRSWSSDSVS